MKLYYNPNAPKRTQAEIDQAICSDIAAYNQEMSRLGTSLKTQICTYGIFYDDPNTSEKTKLMIGKTIVDVYNRRQELRNIRKELTGKSK